MSAVQMLRRQGASDEGTVHAAKWIGRGIQDEKVLRWFPLVCAEVLDKLPIPCCLSPPSIDGYLIE